jgi:hypothetical protein
MPLDVGSEVPEFGCSTARIRLSGAYEYVIEINPPSASQVAATLRRGAVSLEDVVISELRKRRKNSVFDRRSKNPLPSERS